MQEESFETLQGELVLLRTTLENLLNTLMVVTNKVYRAETKIKLLSRDASGDCSQEDSPPQKKVKSCSPIWLPQG